MTTLATIYYAGREYLAPWGLACLRISPEGKLEHIPPEADGGTLFDDSDDDDGSEPAGPWVPLDHSGELSFFDCEREFNAVFVRGKLHWISDCMTVEDRILERLHELLNRVDDTSAVIVRDVIGLLGEGE